MRLDQELMRRGLVESRQEAQECIKLGHVLLDGVVTKKKTQQVDESTPLIVTKRRTFVSRGGEKLEGALLHINRTKEIILKKLKNRTAIDIGSSTGGFTHCLLMYELGAITAVDVGTEQLHHTLRKDPRVTLFENTDIRNFTTKEKYDIVVADLSFISLEKVIDVIVTYGTNGTEYFLLIKPQFEVGSGNTKKGIVKDAHLVQTILKKYVHLCEEMNLKEVVTFPCSLIGGDGNQEYFLHARK